MANSSPPPFTHGWKTADEYMQGELGLAGEKFMQVTDLLLENPNLNSTHLFRADILYDSDGVLQTASEKHRQLDLGVQQHQPAPEDRPRVHHEAAPQFERTALRRTVVRHLIPRKPQLDKPIEQTCHIYDILDAASTICGTIVLYIPQVGNEADVPWYHPPVKALAYLFQTHDDLATISVHYLPFHQDSNEVPTRLHRTFISLLQTFLRLAKNPSPETPQNLVVSARTCSAAELSLAPSAIKDTILPQHTVQDTYTRLKQTYAADLIARWAESTEPSKHVFEDLSIAAFVIELWKTMFTPDTFPGFVDIACGNGVLSYILIKEGWKGRGFDARPRKSWDVLDMNDHLDESICVPKPFIDSLDSAIEELLPDTKIHDGIFAPGTFIISNHADELTPWTPLLATLSSPANPLPFLAIPCCSHALSGAKHRYSPKDIETSSRPSPINNREEEQPASGDLRALRAARAKEKSGADDKSMYGCLTRKVIALSNEVGCAAEVTLMRIPSTRNIGVVGNRRAVRRRDPETQATALSGSRECQQALLDDGQSGKPEHAAENEVKVQAAIERECTVSEGTQAAARTWIERAQRLQTGRGRGKVNWGGKPATAGAEDGGAEDVDKSGHH